jgi:CelD/BcsL family acetyltransferase involved in cellulose biosynthesis
MATGAVAETGYRQAVRGAADASLAIAVDSAMADAEAAWRALETRCPPPPYQRYDWIAALVEAGFVDAASLRILTLSHRGEPVAIIPFALVRHLGMTVARIAGSDISNCDAIVFDTGAAHLLTAEALRAAFREFAATASVDAVDFRSLLAEWKGVANPLMGLSHAPAPNNFYLNEGELAGVPYSRRNNIRRSIKRLSADIGPLSLRRAGTPEEIETFNAVFLEQRASRFRKMGVDNVFARDDFQALFRGSANASLGAKRPLLSYHALFVGEDIVATSIGIRSGRHYSQYINSTSEGPASRYNLMGTLLAFLVEELQADGCDSFDMGLGDFEYKAKWTRRLAVYDATVATSMLGHAGVRVLRAGRRAKRIVKQTPALWNAVTALRKARAKDDNRPREED